MLKIIAKATAITILSACLPAMAQDAQAGKQYQISIVSEDSNEWQGAYGQANIGKVAVLIPGAKKGDKYTIKISDIKTNQYSEVLQASCEFEQIGGNRKGKCVDAP